MMSKQKKIVEKKDILPIDIYKGNKKLSDS